MTATDPAMSAVPTIRIPHILGLDLSLTSSGVASSLGWTARIYPGKHRGLPRLRHIRETITGYVRRYDFAVMEGPSYGHGRLAGHDEMAALRWMVRDDLDRMSIPLAIVPPSTLKLWATGNGHATKQDVAAAMDREYPRPPVGEIGFLDGERYDEADAMALADMGGAWLSSRTGLSPAQRRAMKGVAWPEGEVTLR